VLRRVRKLRSFETGGVVIELSSTYIYERLPLILLFFNGYILYRVIASVGLPEYLAGRAVRFSHGRADILLLSLIVVSAGLSMFIPNAVTVLSMIPVIRKLDSELESMTTALTLSIIYGANIGGMGSLIGSPANLLLIAALDYFDVPGRDQITFFNWFMWALPLVAMFLLLAWAVVRMAIPKYSKTIPVSGADVINAPDSRQKQGLRLFYLFLVFWSFSSVLREFYLGYLIYEGFCAVLFTVVFLWLVFGKGLINARELLRGVPKRGIVFLCMLGLLIVAVRALRLDEYAMQGFTVVMSLLENDGQGGYTLYLVTAVMVILLTEFLSNTVVSTAFFAVIAQLGVVYSINLLPLMVLVSAASPCAFMTPVATPCNSLAVGEMRGMSLRTMFVFGLVLNALGALLLSIWIWLVVPLLY